MATYIPEPFKIKMVEPFKSTTREDRVKLIEEAFYNEFYLRSSDVSVDLLTDSGTGAMSQNQWAAMMLGDEAYSGGKHYFEMMEVAREIFGYKFIQPVHQGRGAEQVAFPCVLKKGKYAIANMHFDTTRAHVEIAGARAIDCVCKEALDTTTPAPFKGNMDVEKMEKLINELGKDNVGAIIITVTNNSAGGQPVSIKNIRETCAVAKKYGIKVVMDSARYAENAYFIKQREPEFKNSSIREIVLEMYKDTDMMTMSAKKDAIVNIGGFVGVKEDPEIYEQVKANCIAFEGFVTYGGLAGRDLAALAVGLKEGVDEAFLKYRIGQIEYLGARLDEIGVPYQTPAGGHAIFLDAKKVLPHIPYYEFPGHALALALYVEGGIRACDIGSYMMGNDPDTGKQIESEFEFTRLAVPRRVYTQSHLDMIIDALKVIKEKAPSYKGYKIVWEPKVLRHFTAKLKPL